jgi:signal transduction histidine kinase/ligand-binding sensor domain-containing protein
MAALHIGEATLPIEEDNPCLLRIVRSLCALGLLALLCILSIPASAERLPMRLYTTEDGLWSGFINHMLRDSRGFLWVCTRDGLSRFDGYRFTNFRIAGGPLQQNFTYMVESRRGIFWMILSDRHLYRYDPRAVTSSIPPDPADQASHDGRVLLHAQLVSSNSLTELFEDRSGNLWAGGESLYLIEEGPGGAALREINLNLPEAWKPYLVRTIAEGNDGSLWLGTSYGLLRRLPDGRVAQYHLDRKAGPGNVHVVLADKDGYVWAAYTGGSFVMRPEPFSSFAGKSAFSSRELRAGRPRAETVLPARAGDAIDLTSLEAFGGQATRISDIRQQANRQIWLAAKDRLVLFDGRRFRSFADARFIFSELIEDSDADLWITTSLGGVLRFSVRGLTSYGSTDGLANPDIASIHEDRNGQLQVVSAGWSINQLVGRRFRSIHPNIPEAGAIWTSPLGFLDRGGQWWLLTGRGLYRFARVRRLEDLAHASPVLYTKLDGLPGQWAYCMFEDSTGDLWISVRDYEKNVSGLVRWRRSNGTFHKLTQADGLPPAKSAASFAEDRAGNLWFGFYEGGLARYARGRFAIYTSTDGLPEGFITALHLDHAGRLWLTSAAGGVARIDDPTAEKPRFFRYTTREGLSSDNARSITEDLAGDMYVGSVRGIDQLTPDTGSVRHYGLRDGLAGDFVTTAYRDRKGVLWFGTFGGLSRLDPQPEPAPAEPPIRIEGLRIAGVERPLGEFGTLSLTGLELSAAQNNLQIDFSSLSMARASMLRYQYRLGGVDHDWNAPTDQRTVHYANLAPGRYQFLVRAIDPSGLTSTQPASVEFEILPHIWQRWWFLTLAAAAMGCAVTLSYRYRVAHLLELERVRTHIATDLHDDIGSSLSQIAVLSEVARRQAEGAAGVSQPLETIASTSRELVDSMSDIVWAINPNRDNLGDLIHRMRRFASDLFTSHDIDFSFHARETERPMRLDADVRRQVFLIFKESAHNIVRHSKCSSVEVDLRMENHAITLMLKDDGRGFDTAQPSHGHGLSSMKRRAKTLRATLEISSRPDGTTVSLKVPLDRRAGLP